MAQCALDARGMGLVASALKDLKQDEVAEQEKFARGGGFRSSRRRRCATAEEGIQTGAPSDRRSRAWARSRSQR
jgi:hypothetical protein